MHSLLTKTVYDIFPTKTQMRFCYQQLIKKKEFLSLSKNAWY